MESDALLTWQIHCNKPCEGVLGAAHKTKTIAKLNREKSRNSAQLLPLPLPAVGRPSECVTVCHSPASRPCGGLSAAQGSSRCCRCRCLDPRSQCPVGGKRPLTAPPWSLMAPPWSLMAPSRSLHGRSLMVPSRSFPAPPRSPTALPQPLPVFHCPSTAPPWSLTAPHRPSMVPC